MRVEQRGATRWFGPWYRDERLTVELQGTMPMDRMAELARRLWLTPGVSETRVEACAWVVA